MAREIVVFPHPTLRKVCDQVHTFDAELRLLVEEMFEAMQRAPGVGLAAPQVDVPRRVVVVDVHLEQEPEGRRALINPEILATHGPMVTMDEGCLSFPEMSVEIVRPEGVTVRYQTVEGEHVEEEASGLLARVYQHEIDHLDGVLMFDHLSVIKRELFKKQYSQILKQREP
ncbi:MAG: peptide deformylase [bacterium]|nr:peptide deformylase [bacterium]